MGFGFAAELVELPNAEFPSASDSDPDAAVTVEEFSAPGPGLEGLLPLAVPDLLALLEFSEFEAQWKEFLAAKEIKPVAGAKIQSYKVKEGKAAEERMDMAEIKSLVARNRAHLGDRLIARGRTGAAVIEYRRDRVLAVRNAYQSATRRLVFSCRENLACCQQFLQCVS